MKKWLFLFFVVPFAAAVIVTVAMSTRTTNRIPAPAVKTVPVKTIGQSIVAGSTDYGVRLEIQRLQLHPLWG